MFSLAASDYLDPLFLPQLVTQIKSLAPNCSIDIHPLSADADYRAHLAQVQQGRIDAIKTTITRDLGDIYQYDVAFSGVGLRIAFVLGGLAGCEAGCLGWSGRCTQKV